VVRDPPIIQRGIERTLLLSRIAGTSHGWNATNYNHFSFVVAMRRMQNAST
jgi:hypothetical protein